MSHSGEMVGTGAVPMIARRFLMLLSLIAPSACGDIADCGIDWALAGSPHLEPVDVPLGRVGQPYVAEFIASVEHGLDNVDFVYDFKIAKGMLPLGTSLLEHHQRADVSGVPTAAGDYAFVLGVEVTEDDTTDSDSSSGCANPGDARLNVSISVS